MAVHTPTAYPLRTVTRGELEQLCQVLWGWPQCPYCNHQLTLSRQQCQDPTHCFSDDHFHRLSLFFDFHKQVSSSYVPDFFDPDDQALRSHQDLFDIISLLRDFGGHSTREDCRKMYLWGRSGEDDFKKDDSTPCNIPLADQERAFNIAATVMTMASASSLNDGGAPSFDMITSDEEQGRTMLQDITSPFLWRPEQSLYEALLDTFPSRGHPSLQPGDPQSKTILHELTAINLTKIAKLKFMGTSDLRNHLRLDPVSGTVYIFHYTSFLKQHLLSSKRDIEKQLEQEPNLTANLDSTSSSQFPQRFTFPRSLALETLQTLNVLFPPPSHPQFHQCQSLLRSLVSKSNFDPDILRFGTTAYQLPSESSPSKIRQHEYPIWGTRLMALHSELEDPAPRGILDNWLERRSKSRHVMMVTLVGVTVAVLLGVLSLGVSIFQAWISWQEWKHPG
ncbi:hypothetical protein V8F33_004356 [Rhypophila sp. PSN 637]